MKDTLKKIWSHAPAYLAVLLVVINALIDAGVLTIPDHVLTLINAVLLASGVGIIHGRQQAQK
jgi:hypothetical protein